MAKREQTVLCIEDKLSICTHMSQGEKPASLAREYGVGKSMMVDIIKEVTLQQTATVFPVS